MILQEKLPTFSSWRSESLGTSRRGRRLSRSPPPRRSRCDSKRAAGNIDGVIQSLLKINDSLNAQVYFLWMFLTIQRLSHSKILPESGVSLPREAADTSSFKLSYSEDGRRLKNELVKIREEITVTVLRAAEIERELEAANVPIIPDGSQVAELGHGEVFVPSSFLFLCLLPCWYG